MQYRREIDGLRALAVLPVLFFHAGLSGFSGGFVGVDIFFVISGFLISGILIDENEKKSFSFGDFYERRARRLIPAFVAVLASTLALSLVFSPPEHLHNLGMGLISSTGVFSNYHYMHAFNYFASNADKTPLLHIWSLSVEEQYYVGFPIVIYLCYKLSPAKISSRSFAHCFCVIGFLLSLIYMLLLNWKGYNDIGFFSVFSRAWELLAGALLAFNIKKIPESKKLNEAMSLVGLLLVVFSITYLDKHVAWPSTFTFIPVLGAVLLLAFARPNNITGVLLTNKIVVFTGLISYSLYLWHQPVLSLTRIVSFGEPSLVTFIFAILVSFGLAILTHRFIEKPFRNKKLLTRSKVFGGSLCALLLIALSGFVLHNSSGFPERYVNYKSNLNVKPIISRERGCLNAGRASDKPFKDCILGSSDKAPEWAVMGDSHSNEFAIVLSKKIPEKRVQQLSVSGCGPSWKFNPESKSCRDFNLKAMKLIIESDSIKNVVFVYRHGLYLRGEPHEDRSFYKKESFAVKPLKWGDDFNVLERYSFSFSSMVGELIQAGKVVYVIAPIPELKAHAMDYNVPTSVFGSVARGDLKKAISHEYYLKTQRAWFEVKKSLPEKSIYIDAWSALGGKEQYSAISDSGMATYFDDDHLTQEGIAPLVNEVLNN